MFRSIGDVVKGSANTVAGVLTLNPKQAGRGIEKMITGAAHTATLGMLRHDNEPSKKPTSHKKAENPALVKSIADATVRGPLTAVKGVVTLNPNEVIKGVDTTLKGTAHTATLGIFRSEDSQHPKPSRYKNEAYEIELKDFRNPNGIPPEADDEFLPQENKAPNKSCETSIIEQNQNSNLSDMTDVAELNWHENDKVETLKLM